MQTYEYSDKIVRALESNPLPTTSEVEDIEARMVQAFVEAGSAPDQAAVKVRSLLLRLAVEWDVIDERAID